MNILVTGAAGYLGSTLIPLLLEQGHSVVGLDSLRHACAARPLMGVWPHPRFRFVRGDVRDSGAVAAALRAIDAVVHLAAIVGDPACARDPLEAKAINLGASLTLAEACEKAGVRRFIFASTCSNYGKMTDPNGIVNESSELQPVSLYAETKVGVERAILDRSRFKVLCTTALRLSTLFGAAPRMRFDLTVNEFVLKLVADGKLVVFGEQFWRPYVHVRDAALAVALVLSRPEAEVDHEVFNVGADDLNYRKSDLLKLMESAAPGAKVERVHKTEDPRDYRVGFAKIRSRLGYKPERTVEDGIREIADLVHTGALPDLTSSEFTNTP